MPTTHVIARRFLVPLSAVTILAVAGGGLANAKTLQSEDRSLSTAAKAAPRGVTLSPSARDVNEGDRFTLTTRIASASSASRVTLEKLRPPLYSGAEAEWTPVERKRVRGRGEIDFDVVAVERNAETYRAVAAYHGAPTRTSKKVRVTVWRWVALSEYDPYYEAERYATGFGTTHINGQSYSGWGPYIDSHTGSWESRFTPGRHCRAFRAVIGVADISHDDSSGVVTLVADDNVVYESPILTPGMETAVSVSIALPYRFGIQLLDTSTDGTTGRDEVESWPVLGEPAFNCTGV